jgi:hypothetical protein
VILKSVTNPEQDKTEAKRRWDATAGDGPLAAPQNWVASAIHGFHNPRFHCFESFHAPPW